MSKRKQTVETDHTDRYRAWRSAPALFADLHTSSARRMALLAERESLALWNETRAAAAIERTAHAVALASPGSDAYPDTSRLSAINADLLGSEREQDRAALRQARRGVALDKVQSPTFRLWPSDLRRSADNAPGWRVVTLEQAADALLYGAGDPLYRIEATKNGVRHVIGEAVALHSEPWTGGARVSYGVRADGKLLTYHERSRVFVKHKCTRRCEPMCELIGTRRAVCSGLRWVGLYSEPYGADARIARRAARRAAQRSATPTTTGRPVTDPYEAAASTLRRRLATATADVRAAAAALETVFITTVEGHTFTLSNGETAHVEAGQVTLRGTARSFRQTAQALALAGLTLD